MNILVLAHADTENDVAGLFVRAPNGLCMDFDALSEEVFANTKPYLKPIPKP